MTPRAALAFAFALLASCRATTASSGAIDTGRPDLPALAPEAAVVATPRQDAIDSAAAASSAVASSAAREDAVVTADGVRLRLHVVGGGPEVVVVVHGASGLGVGYMVDDFAPLATPARTLVFWDQRGNGLSAAPDDSAAYGLATQVADLEAVRVRMGAERVSVVGHSWGGLVAASYAAAHPDRVSRLLLLSPIPPAMDGQFTAFRRELDRRARGQLGMRTALISVDTTIDEATRCERIARTVYAHYVSDTAAFDGMRGRWCAPGEDALVRLDRTSRLTRRAVGAWDVRPQMRAIAAQTLVVHGSEDPLPLAAGRRWAAGIPQARLIVLGGVGHFAWLESPARAFDVMDAFLRGEWPVGAERAN